MTFNLETCPKCGCEIEGFFCLAGHDQREMKDYVDRGERIKKLEAEIAGLRTSHAISEARNQREHQKVVAALASTEKAENELVRAKAVSEGRTKILHDAIDRAEKAETRIVRQNLKERADDEIARETLGYPSGYEWHEYPMVVLAFEYKMLKARVAELEIKLHNVIWPGCMIEETSETHRKHAHLTVKTYQKEKP